MSFFQISIASTFIFIGISFLWRKVNEKRMSSLACSSLPCEFSIQTFSSRISVKRPTKLCAQESFNEEQSSIITFVESINPLGALGVHKLFSFLFSIAQAKHTQKYYHEDLLKILNLFSSGIQSGQKIIEVFARQKEHVFVTSPFKLVVTAARGACITNQDIGLVLQELSQKNFQNEIARQKSILERLCHLLISLIQAEKTGCKMHSFVASFRDAEISKNQLLQKLNRETMAIRFQGTIVSLCPAIILALVCLFSKEKFQFFFSTFGGQCCLAFAIALNILGTIAVWIIANERAKSVSEVV